MFVEQPLALTGSAKNCIFAGVGQGKSPYHGSAHIVSQETQQWRPNKVEYTTHSLGAGGLRSIELG